MKLPPLSLIGLLARAAKTPRSGAFRAAALCAGALLFLAVFPALLTRAGSAVGEPASFPRALRLCLGAVCAAGGLAWIVWAVHEFWTRGGGTPNPAAPTRRLVVTGPFRLSRNPIELGAVFYWGGIGLLACGPVCGLFNAAAALGLGSLYHRGVEERELELRFGEEYRLYRAATPFLVPRIFNVPRRPSSTPPGTA